MNRAVLDVIRAAAAESCLCDGTACRLLSVAAIEAVAADTGLSLREVEISALQNGVIPERYLRNLKTYTPAEQAALLKSTVGVVGLGGLGGGVVEVLARAGVGRLILVDGDRFEGHNLNRQLLGTCRLLGTAKALAAAQRVSAVNPAVEISAHEVFVDETNAEGLLSGSQVVVDCLDNLPARFVLESAAKKINAPLVSAAVAGLTGQMTTIYPQDPGLVRVYGNPGEFPPKGAETTLGCLPQAVLLLAALEAGEALKILLGHPHPLRNRLLLVDLVDGIFDTMQLD